jgi:outer membrane protein assembly factor BamB
VYDGTVYIGSEVPAGQSYFAAIDAATGDEQWTTPISQYVSSPAVSQSRDELYVGGNETLYALSPADGSELWTFETGEFLRTEPSVRDGTVYIGNRDGLYAVSAETGDEQWFYDTPANNVADTSQAVLGEAVYLTDGDGVSAVARETGDELWRTPSSADQLPLVTSNAVYATAGRGSSFEAFSTATGEKLWELERALNGRPLFSEGRLYGGGVNGVYAFA